MVQFHSSAGGYPIFQTQFTEKTVLSSTECCFNFLGCHNKTPQTGWLKQQNLFSHSSWGCKSKNLSFLWSLSSRLADGCPLTISSQDHSSVPPSPAPAPTIYLPPFKHQSYWSEVPLWRPCFNLITSLKTFSPNMVTLSGTGVPTRVGTSTHAFVRTQFNP